MRRHNALLLGIAQASGTSGGEKRNVVERGMNVFGCCIHNEGSCGPTPGSRTALSEKIPR